MKITLPDQSIKEYEGAVTPAQVAAELSEGLARETVAAVANGKLVAPEHTLIGDTVLSLVTKRDPLYVNVLRHTASHVLAQAVLRLYPNTKLAIGPAIENGFYYDFDFKEPISSADIEKIEKEMAKIAAEKLELKRFLLSRENALEKMKEQPYKQELISELPEGEEISFYQQGEFTDLCAGPHLKTTAEVKHFKILSITGAYWRGNEKNKMLTRIYATAFTKKQELDDYLVQLEEAKKRDHNKLGRELELFTTSDVIGQGLPILLPKGARIIQLLQRFVEDEEQKRGWLLTKTPFMAKSDLYKISGHWDHYKEGMFVMGDEDKDDEVFALRPMTCPFQYQAYLNRPRSYRDLPLRYAETSTLFRKEASGEMCTPEQLEDEFKKCLELTTFMLKTLGLYEDVSYRFSQWDPEDRDKYIGTPEQWDEAQGAMQRILDHLGLTYKIGIGEAAFYGPKLDIQIKNVHGKEDTLITIQIDQMLAENFGMEYTDKDGEKKHPYIIHRTSIGCYERTLALLIEKYAGAFPVWLAPVQVKVMNITDRVDEACKTVVQKLSDASLRVEYDSRNEKIGYKIREAQLEKVPYMLIVGDREAAEGKVAVRSRKEGDLGTMTVEEFQTKILLEVATKQL